MNKQPIITILLALVAVTGQAQTFIPVVEDSIDFVIEGTVSEGADSVCMNERPYTVPLWFPVHNKHFRIAVRQPLHKFLQIEDGRDGRSGDLVATLLKGTSHDVDSLLDRALLDTDQHEGENQLH